MTRLCLLLVLVAFAIALPATALARLIGHRLGAHDTPPVRGQTKFAPRRIPNTGGIAIFFAITLPILFGIRAVIPMAPGAAPPDHSWLPAAFFKHIAGIQRQSPLALLLVGSLTLLHILGFIDDRRPLGPWIKLLIMAIPAVAVPIFSD